MDYSLGLSRDALQAWKSDINHALGILNVACEQRCSEEHGVSQSVDLGQNNNPNTTPTKDCKKVRVVVCLCGVQRGCAEEGERGSTPTG